MDHSGRTGISIYSRRAVNNVKTSRPLISPTVSPDAIKEHLKQVKYPGFSRDIVSFGLVRSAAWIDGTVKVSLLLTTHDPKTPLTVKTGADAWPWYYSLTAFLGGFVAAQMLIVVLYVFWEAFGGNAYTDMVVRLKLRQAFGRLIRRAGDKGHFVILDPRLASRFTTAFPQGVQISLVGLVDALDMVRA